MTQPIESENSGVTEDGFLDNQVRLRQPRTGYRAAIDPVFLWPAFQPKMVKVRWISAPGWGLRPSCWHGGFQD